MRQPPQGRLTLRMPIRQGARHESWPYLPTAGLLLGGFCGLVWPYNPVAWHFASAKAAPFRPSGLFGECGSSGRS